MKIGEESFNNYDYDIYTEPTSRINPLIANIFLLILVSAATIESRVYNLSVILFLPILISFIVSRKPIQILKIMLIAAPFGLGLGIFYSIIGNKEILTALLTILLRIEILTTSSTILYYGVDPWELPPILINKFKTPPHISYTIALAFIMYQRLIKDLKEIIDSLRSKNIIRNELDYIIRVHVILYVLVYHAIRRAEEMEIALEARNFNPLTRNTRKNLRIRFWEILLIALTLIIIVLLSMFGKL
ncbi:MAG: energy-coupling factor transporter transmembrane protein EcfT [Thaumarchaeota archaeon]|jgi:energy-coupling factor transporter transmembrane protein EcfT|nr:energy-coupling factor transporter transmembrane protein EcfT [Candidatus Geocrenenecus arthurdayi]MCL7397002.1 energy-coupling factor transporter transmembrane protein EcfT [Candidatus Geocrenenecus arthurdayi]